MVISLTTEQEYISLIILIVGCILMLVGFTAHKSMLGPWIMLLGICASLGVIAYNILYLVGTFS